MDKKTKTFNVILVILSVIMLLPTIFFTYMQIWGKNNLPTAMTSTYVTKTIDPHTNEELAPISANYYANKNGRGKEVIEILFNCYSGVDKQAVYSRGFQLVFEENNESTLYYYDKYDGVSFITGHIYNENDPFIVDIDGTTYGLKLDGTYTVISTNFDSKKLARTIFTGCLNFLFEDTKLYSDTQTTYTYTFKDLLVKFRDIIKSCSNGYGDNIIPLIDLGDFLHIYELDKNSCIKGTPLNNTSFINSYFTVDTHYDNRGMIWAKQSMFKSVAGDYNYNLSGITDNVDYWTAKSTINITQEDMVARTTIDGNFYSLSLDKLKELKEYSDIDINVTIDISKIPNVTVLGLDFYAFYGLKLGSLTIKSNNPQNFILSQDSLKNSGLKTVSSMNVTLINNNSGVTLI